MKKDYILLAGAALLCLMVLQMTVSPNPASAAEVPTYFELTVIAPTNNPQRVQHSQVIVQEFSKIGIKADLVLVGWDILIPRMFDNIGYTGYADGGFDIGFVGWTGSLLNPSALYQFFHSSGDDKSVGGSNYYPINIPELDDILSEMQAEPDEIIRQQWVNKALDYIIWEHHPVTALYQEFNPFAVDAEIRGFDPTRWSNDGPTPLPETYFADDQTEFVWASPSRFEDLNPLISLSYYDNVMHVPIFSGTYSLDSNLLYQPELASGPPIAVGSDDFINASINPATISPDSPYYGEETWGPNPNVDFGVTDGVMEPADRSMLLVNLRPNIPWHGGWGYDDNFRYVTADDLIWSMSYVLDPRVPQPVLGVIQSIMGADYTLACEKINDTMVKYNARGPLGTGLYADYYAVCSWNLYPRHVLDPTYNAGPFGGSVGVTPDGTTIAAYEDHATYAFNTGAKPLVGCGPYTMESWTESTQTFIAKKFDDWGGEGANSLWNEAPYNQNNIETYAVTIIDEKSQAMIQLENEQVDAVDSNFGMSKDIPYLETKPNIQVITFVDAVVQSMGYNTYHPKLTNRFVRLAISHLIPRDELVSYILGGQGETNEVLGIPHANPYYPEESDWATIGLPESFNTEAADGTLLKFQGHVERSVEKAWALMEMAGYDMDPLRAAYEPEETVSEEEDSPLPLLPMMFAVLALAAVRLVYRKRT